MSIGTDAPGMLTSSHDVKPQGLGPDNTLPLLSRKGDLVSAAYHEVPAQPAIAPADSNVDLAVFGMLSGFELFNDSAGQWCGTTDGALSPFDATTQARQVQVIDPSKFAQVAEPVLRQIDANGALTKTELIRAIQDPQFTGEQAQVLAAMYKNFDALRHLTEHKNIHGITAADLEKYQSEQDLLALLQPRFQTAEWALSKFSGGKGALTEKDLVNAINNPKTSNYERAALIQLGNNWRHFSTNSGITSESLNRFWYGHHPQLVDSVRRYCQQVADRAQAAGISNTLYGPDAAAATDSSGEEKAALASIKHGDLKQGDVGDCYFEASLSALAKTNPQAIKDMITQVSPDHYSVKFPGARDAVAVRAPTEAELGLYNGATKYGYWGSVIEKAYGQYRESLAKGKSNTDVTSTTPQEFLGKHPDYAKNVFRLLTGKRATVIDLEPTMNEADVAKLFAAVLDAKSEMAVTATIDGPPPTNGYQETPDHFAKDHEYTVTRFVPDKHGSGMVTIRNPWDRHDGPLQHATVTIPLAEFLQDFNCITIAGH